MFCDPASDFVGFHVTTQVGRSDTQPESLQYGGLDRICSLLLAQVFQQQSSAANGSDWIGDPLPGDVRRRPMDGLEHGVLARVDVCRRCQPEPPRQLSCKVA